MQEEDEEDEEDQDPSCEGVVGTKVTSVRVRTSLEVGPPVDMVVLLVIINKSWAKC